MNRGEKSYTGGGKKKKTSELRPWRKKKGSGKEMEGWALGEAMEGELAVGREGSCDEPLEVESWMNL